MNDKKLYFQLGEILVQLHPLGRFGFETFRGQDCGRVFLGQVGSQFADLLGKNKQQKHRQRLFLQRQSQQPTLSFFPPHFPGDSI
jgi:hypothetical protein